ncbi:serine/threonine-protein kinase [Actinomadura formosensis]|uniref:serine/threonine-protein kinase n=1 Tax=Actinomadura formosensis TaxID=60706 RepID=UPI00082E7C93|nr:serine/threonine-protein kinase [Actinomadura formosensis]
MSTGLVLGDRYRLLERLAIGGMGEVWRASDAASGRQVAVKLLRLEFGSDLRARDRFESEARFAAELRHPGIARAFDFGEQDGRTFLVMELVAGEPLEEILTRDGGLPLEAVLDLMVQVGRALTVAHEAGIVHRDVKPANLMVSPDGAVKITDFGIARRLAAASQTQTGMVMGTAHYISPEQAQGKELSPAADLYSLGVVAYECLTGAPPFDGATPVEVALKHVRNAPAELPARVSPAARELIMEMLAKEPLDRPVNAGTVAARALAIRASLRVGRPGESPDSDTIITRSGALSEFDAGLMADNLAHGPVQRRTRLTYASVAAVLVLICVIVIGSLWKGLAFAGFGKDERDPPTSPATTPAGGRFADDPATRSSAPPRNRVRPAVTPRHRTHRIRPSTRATSKTSSYKPSTKSPRATATAPKPTPMGSTTAPSTPNPDPSPTDSGGLGSEDKV